MENLPTPLSRVELYLAKACGMDVTVPEQPLSRLEQFLAIIAGDTSVPMPTPMSLTEQWLAYVLGVTPDPLLAVEGACLIGAQKVDARYFAVAASMPGATLPDAPQNRAEMYWAHIAVNPPTPGILKYVTGTSIHLTDVVSGIEELQYVHGDTLQNGTPTPDSPIPIQVVTGAQTVKVVGKNLWGGFVNEYSSTDHQVAFVNYKDGSISANGTADAAAYSMYAAAAASEGRTQQFPAGTYTLSGGTSSLRAMFIIVGPGTSYTTNAITGKVTFTLSETVSGYIRAYVQSGTSANETIHPQLEINSTATAYEPYQSQSYTVDLGSIELCKIGDYQDYIYKSGDDWYVHKEVDKYVFDGNESWNTTPYGTNSWILSNVIYFNFVSDKIQIMSNIATGIAHADRNTTTPNLMYSGQYNAFNFRNTSFATLSALQTATKDNYVYYAIASPTDTKITDVALISQLDALNSAALPKPIANITVGATGTNLTPYLTIAYYGSN